jgi:putative DNA primase/helicase
MSKSTPRAPARPRVSRPAKPPSALVDDEAAARIPAELRDAAQWVVWAWAWDEDASRWRKPPIDPRKPRGRNRIKYLNPTSWVDFEAARNLVHRGGDGIGLSLGEEGLDDLVGVDFDHCLDEHGAIIKPDVARRVKALDSYTERTPSRDGLRVWVKGSIPESGRRKDEAGTEVYAKRRYFTVTGQHAPGTPATINRRQEALDALWAELWPEDKDKDKPKANGRANGHAALSDDELLDRARRARDGAKFSALFDGDDTEGENPSGKDMGLMNMLAYWTGRDAERMAMLFGQSARGARAKCRERADYIPRTIKRAIADCKRIYHPPPGRNGDGRPGPSEDGRPEIEVNEGAEDPHRLARIHFEKFRRGGSSSLKFHRGAWLQWSEGAYRPETEGELQCGLVRSIKAEFDRLNRAALKLWAKDNADKDKPKDKPQARIVTSSLVSNVILALRSMTLLANKIESPAWIGDSPAGRGRRAPYRPNPVELVPTRGALIHLPSVVEVLPHKRKDGRSIDTSRAIIPATPEFFCLYALDFDFSVDAPPPVEWLKFLVSVFGEDSQAIGTLQEWMGYVITPDTRQHKIAVLIGPPRSGRGTIARIIRRLVGPENVAGPRISAFASQFGLESLIGKPLAIVGDARISGRTDAAAIAEAMLSISGDDVITIDRKHRPSWTGKPGTRLMLISNDIPRLPDDSGALASRFLLLRFMRSFLGKEDPELEGRLVPELPGILLWAIMGWQRLMDRGHFLQPESGQELIDVARDSSSPVGAYIREREEEGRIVIEAGRQVAIAELFSDWCLWCAEKKRDQPGDESGFGRKLHSVVPTIKTDKRRGDRSRGEDKAWVRFYEGIGLEVPRLE